MSGPMLISSSNTVRNAALVVVLICLGGAAARLMLQPTSQPSPDAGRKVVAEFLKLLQDGQAEQAWQSTTAEFKSAEGRESFVRFVKENEFLAKPLEFDSMLTVNVQDQARTEFVFHAPGTKKSVRLVLGREAGLWKIDRLTVH